MIFGTCVLILPDVELHPGCTAHFAGASCTVPLTTNSRIRNGLSSHVHSRDEDAWVHQRALSGDRGLRSISSDLTCTPTALRSNMRNQATAYTADVRSRFHRRSTSHATDVHSYAYRK